MYLLLLLVLLPTLFRAATVVQSASADSDNVEDFAALCRLINVATTSPPDAEKAIATEEIAPNITAAGESISEGNFTPDHDKAANADYPTQATPGQKQKWKHHWFFWKTAKDNIKGNKKSEYAANRLIKFTPAVQLQIQALAKGAMETLADVNRLAAAEQKANFDKAITDALYGKNKKNDAANTYGGACRAETCGKTDDSGGTLAGSSLRFDILCLCAFKSSAADAGKSCCATCDQDTADGANTDDWVLTQDASKRYTHLEKQCRSYAPTVELSTTNLQAALAAFCTRLQKPKGGNSKKLRLLGKVDNDGTAGCTGNTDNNGRRCVQYTKQQLTNGQEAVSWIKKLKEAAEAADSRRAAATEIKTLELHLRILNVTVNNLLKQEEQRTVITPGKKQVIESVNETDVTCEKKGKEDNCKDGWKEVEEKDKTKCKLNKNETKNKHKTEQEREGQQQIISKGNYKENAQRLQNVNGKIMIERILAFSSIRNLLGVPLLRLLVC
uniref:Variant surface glycoprotein 1125.4314 n=1 Tax=Trypanosoma brucei TaxID=5691 RepID=A0A1J0RAQ1_9TRYP|nr:variant surface glycoprotein 1125.4314 [Trypanosoma brucei]